MDCAGDTMDRPDLHALVVRALTVGLTNCVVWKDDKTMQRVRDNPSLHGLSPSYIRKGLIEHVKAGGAVKQIIETRDEYKDDYDFYYRAVIPLSGFPHGVFVEMILVDDDPEVPVVALVSAHPQYP